MTKCDECGTEIGPFVRVVGPDDRPGRTLCAECMFTAVEGAIS